MNQTSDNTLQEWCDKVATLGVNMLLENGIINREAFDIAVKLVSEEIRIRILMRDRPPNA